MPKVVDEINSDYELPVLVYVPEIKFDSHPYGKQNNDILKTEIPEKKYTLEQRAKLDKILELSCEKHNGLGISSNQLDLYERAFYSYGKTYFNPRILSHSNNTVNSPEGCLSLPNVKATVRRWESIEVSYEDVFGEDNIEVLIGMDGIVFQHELDHINGYMLFDRIPSKFSRDKFWKKYKKSF